MPAPYDPPVTPVPRPGPQVDPGPAIAGIPDWLVFGTGLLVVGAFISVVDRWSDSAAYALALLIILGYASTGGRLDAVIAFLKSMGVIKQ